LAGLGSLLLKYIITNGKKREAKFDRLAEVRIRSVGSCVNMRMLITMASTTMNG